MTNGTLTIYKQLPIDEKRNFLIEFPGLYFSSAQFDKTEFKNIFIKTTDNDINVRVPLEGATAFNKFNQYNYAVYDLGNANLWYYFIRSIKWVANNTILLEMHLDALTTFGRNLLDSLTKRTMTIREHRSRFEEEEFDPTNKNAALTNIIDNVSESFTPPKFRISNIAILQSDKRLEELQWYLVYKTRDDISTENATNPVSCFLYPSGSLIRIREGHNVPITFSYSDFEEGKHYIFMLADNPAILLGCSWGYTINPTFSGLGVDFVNDGAKLNVYSISADSSGNVTENLVSAKLISESPSVIFERANAYRKLSYFSSMDDIYKQDFVFLGIQSPNVYWNNSIDYSDSKLIKVINLPYCPVDHVFNSREEFSLPYWHYDYLTGLLKSDSVTNEMGESDLTTYDLSIYAVKMPFSNFASMTWETLINTARSIQDPKLFCSDFYDFKFSYDIFSYDLKLENVYFTMHQSPNVSFHFKPTNTINGNLLFTLTLNNAQVQLENDYPVIASTRNNEMPLFNNNFVNYIRSGYNYDKKSKAVESEARWVGFAISTIGTIASAAVGGPVGMASAVVTGASAVGQLVSAISGQAQSDNDMASKLSQLKLQASNISSCDDQDLLRHYNGNRLRGFVYAARSNILSMADDLFYYYGYATNRQKIPDYKTRLWFNFVQCSPDFDLSANGANFNQCIEEVTQKFKDGVTIFHPVKLNDAIYYDLAQDKENWETWIYNNFEE